MINRLQNRDVVVIGASAGGLPALGSIVEGLPCGLPVSLFIVLHMQREAKSRLAQLMARRSAMPVVTAQHGERVRHGCVYVAAPDQHLTLRDGHVWLTRGPAQNRNRPSIDVLFRSAALSYGSRVIGVVLTGFLSDGTLGLRCIKHYGGITIVQDPTTAQHPNMPDSALRNVQVDHCAALEQIPELIIELTSRPHTAEAVDHVLAALHRFESDADEGKVHQLEEFAAPSSYVCPDCGGGLWEMGGPLGARFRCRVGHGYSLDSLMESQRAQMETALWAAMRSLEDRAALSRRLADEWRGRDADEVVTHFLRSGEENAQHAATLRGLLGLPKTSERA